MGVSFLQISVDNVPNVRYSMEKVICVKNQAQS